MNLEDSKNCGIYCWTNKTNGKKYVGQSENLRKRKTEFLNFNLSYSGRRIDSARKRYNSAEYWEYEILEYCTPEELDDKEQIYIYFYNTLNPKLGYNLNIGGGSNRGCVCSEETKQKLRDYFKGKPLSKEHCKKISESLKGKYVGEKSSNYGKKMPEHVKQKLKESVQRKVKQLNKETLEVIKIWDSITDFAKANDVTGSSISDVCQGKANTAYGYKWCYAEDERPPEFIEKKKDKIVLQFDKEMNFIKEWDSIKKAAESLNINEGCISGCCSGAQNTAGGYIWKYKNPEDFYKSTKPKRNKKILQYDLNANLIKIWNNRREIFEHLHLPTDTIKRCLYRKLETAHNFIWRYEDDDREVKPFVKTPNHKKSVYQIDNDTDEIINEFISAAEAGRIVGISNSKITNCCRGKQQTAGGFKWKYKDDK